MGACDRSEDTTRNVGYLLLRMMDVPTSDDAFVRRQLAQRDRGSDAPVEQP